MIPPFVAKLTVNEIGVVGSGSGPGSGVVPSCPVSMCVSKLPKFRRLVANKVGRLIILLFMKVILRLY